MYIGGSFFVSTPQKKFNQGGSPVNKISNPPNATISIVFMIEPRIKKKKNAGQIPAS